MGAGEGTHAGAADAGGVEQAKRNGQASRMVPGDYCLAADGLPAGRIERVLPAPSGERLLVARAYAPGSYLVAAVTQVVGTEVVAVAPTTELRWHMLALPLVELLRRGTFRRELSHLMRDPLPAGVPPAPDDEAAAAEVRQALAGDPLTADGTIEVTVLHGVAVLTGWLGAVGSKVAAERLARTPPRVWDVVNGLVSDEELSAAARDRLRALPEAVSAVQAVRATGGEVLVTLRPRQSLPNGVLESLQMALPQARSVRIEPTDEQ